MDTSFQGFRALIEFGPQAISLIDAQGEILYGSPSASRLFGYAREELLGFNCLDLIHPEDRDRSDRALKEVLNAPPVPLQWEARVRRKDGQYSWVENTASNLLFDLEVQAIVMHQRDIDAQKAAEAERLEHIAQLAAANLRLEEFAYTAAHDLREPLRAISGCVDLLIKKTPLEPETKRLAKFVVDGAVRMSVLIDDLLSFATSGVCAPPQNVYLEHAVAHAVQNLTAGVPKAVVTVGPMPMISGDVLHLTRLFQNLFSNAVKYRGPDPIEIHVSAERQGANWEIRVKDNGIGIAPEHQARIFKPFVRLDNQDIPGTGLGLSVCTRIVEEHGGVIWVESEVGNGSTFCFTISAMKSQAAA